MPATATGLSHCGFASCSRAARISDCCDEIFCLFRPAGAYALEQRAVQHPAQSDKPILDDAGNHITAFEGDKLHHVLEPLQTVGRPAELKLEADQGVRGYWRRLCFPVASAAALPSNVCDPAFTLTVSLPASICVTVMPRLTFAP